MEELGRLAPISDNKDLLLPVEFSLVEEYHYLLIY